ncbi:hypothetical protein CPB84DRAFT_1781523 [Gymnopilus junonius]|uniref:BRCT domain-containing protein n=1 Tax=Gymnopilus junonius TaxID=109634 RepID=A0A9P5TM71_GYMJU|nr:hypothetical protein CPB84DRAFT_1781523 [Gymnopilus junonius]
MTEAVFPERRTRSQLTLPDEILQIPEFSPLKGARTALRNNAHNLTPSPSDDSDDELLLSPGKHGKQSSSSKRSASPPPQDEYALGPGPSEGRELKRTKRDLPPPKGNESHSDSLKGSNALRQRLLSTHTRTHSDSNVATFQRPSRKRSATTSKKPSSTISASPPPTLFSPTTTTPKKNRAQSVPLFPSTHDLPRIDFRNIPPSPKRSRSPSRSPSKEAEMKQRIPSAMFVGSSSLPTIHDEVGNNMDVDQDKAVTVEAGQISTEDKATASVEADQTSTKAEQGMPLLTHVQTAIIEPGIPTPYTPSTSVIPSLPTIPATPVSQSFDKLLSLSPLTPLPETPLPPRKTPYEGTEDRFAINPGWDLGPTEDTTTSSQILIPPPPIAPSTSRSRLPRPSIAPPPVPAQSSRFGTMGPPALPAKSKNLIVPTRNPIKVPRNAFDVLMGKTPLEAKENSEKNKGKARQNPVKPMPSNLFSSSSGAKLSVAAPSSSQSKVKMKNKMRPKGKSKPEKPHVIAPISDEEDEEEDISDPWRTTEVKTVTEPESELEIKRPSVELLQPSKPVKRTTAVERPLVEQALMNPPPANTRNEMEPMFEMPIQDAAMEDKAPKVEATPNIEAAQDNSRIPSEDEVIPETPPQTTPESPKESGSSTVESTVQKSSVTPQDEIIPETPPRTTRRTPPGAEELVTEENKEQEKSQGEPADSRPPSRIRASKLPLGKKKQPIAVPPASRVTRSVSNMKTGKEVEVLQPRTSGKATKSVGAKRKLPGTVTKPVVVPPVDSSRDDAETDVFMDVAEDTTQLFSGSPMKLDSSPAKTPKRKAPVKSPMKFSLGKPMSSPSPTKVARSSTLFSSKPTINMGASSSLSTLSNALEKLRMPAPSRPSTSMGFNRDAAGNNDDGLEKSKDDTAVGRASLGMGQPARGLKRSSTVGNSFKVPNPAASSSKVSTSLGKDLVHKSLAMFMSNKGGIAKTGTGSLIRGTGKTTGLGSKSIFGVGGGLRRTISKKTTLPVVIGSPVKGGGVEGTEEGEDEEGQDRQTQGSDDADVFMATTSTTSTSLTLDNLDPETFEKGKGKEQSSSKLSDASRRVSMVSHALSQSLNMPPPPPHTRGLMGPPATPPSGRRSASSSYPSTSAGENSPSTGTRSSARIAKAAEQMKTKPGADGHVSAGKKGLTPPPNPAVEALKVLKDCVIFVDVKTDDGEEAGSLFVEMLEGVGARVLTRVGQTCTHIVYKNGLMSTVTRYRLLRDPKPFVVGIGWVVECVEQRKRVGEEDFLVVLDGTHVAGVNKRRRSMLPRLLATELSFRSETEKDENCEADQSIDGSNSSITMDDDLAPLERARRRKSLMTGPKA